MNIIRHIADWIKEAQQNRKINKILNSNDIRWVMIFPSAYGIVYPHKRKDDDILFTSYDCDNRNQYHCVNSKKLLENVYELNLKTDVLYMTKPFNKMYLVSSDMYYFVSDYLVRDPFFPHDERWKQLLQQLISQIQRAKELNALNEAMKTGAQYD